MRRLIIEGRRRERGVTLLITAVALVVMLGMAALAIDVVTLYLASGEAQKNADAAALAGAKAFVSSGFTSGQLGDPTTGTAQGLVCNGSTGLADYQAQAVAQTNFIAGAVPTTVTTSCSFSQPKNPQITVAVTRTGLPTFFARIWSRATSSVSGTAKAEAYNPSGSTTAPIEVHAVKPWLIPNCASPCPPAGPAFFDPATYDIVPTFSTTFIGTSITLRRINLGNTPTTPTPALTEYYPINIPITPPNPVCPSSSAVSCSSLGAGLQADYHDNIACSGTYQFSCNQQVGPGAITVDTGPPAAIKTATSEGTKCLIHADNDGVSQGQDSVNPVPAGAPITIAGGYNNPNSALRTASSISRSDSVVTVPVYSGVKLCSGPTTCTQTANVIGFLQLGIQDVDTTPAHNIRAVILNAAGCNPANSGNAVNGGGVSPVPVRLTQ